jgi:dihydroorotate dehydrogenase
MSFYSFIVRPALFRTDPEIIHHRVFRWLKIIFRFPFVKNICSGIYSNKDKRLHRHLLGIDFPNPVGLAAGFDKDGKLFNELSSFGFGFIEVGTVTPLPQPGNDKPRMFRLPDDQAIINRMGFNNEGVRAMTARLKNRNGKIIIGGNIGKNKNTPNESSLSDYETCFRELFDVVDYFAVNVSSPNTPGLRSLQEKEPLQSLLIHLQMLNDTLSSEKKVARKPVLLKIAPDLSEAQLDEIIDVTIATKLDGIIATNTTIDRRGLKSSKHVVDSAGAGGLSGKPLRDKSTEVIRYLAQRSGKKFVLIGAGGIHSAEDALMKLNAGADLIQVYTGFIYEGPGLIKKINDAILQNESRNKRKKET